MSPNDSPPRPLTPSHLLYPDEPPSPPLDSRGRISEDYFLSPDYIEWQNKTSNKLADAERIMTEAKSELDKALAKDDPTELMRQLSISRQLLDSDDDPAKIRMLEEYLLNLNNEYDELRTRGTGEDEAQEYHDNLIAARKRVIEQFDKFLGKVKDDQFLALENSVARLQAELAEEKLRHQDTQKKLDAALLQNTSDK
jgi:hypothetical protein